MHGQLSYFNHGVTQLNRLLTTEYKASPTLYLHTSRVSLQIGAILDI